MSNTNDGGPAFPHDGQANYTGGLSMRDWFAGQALAGICANARLDLTEQEVTWWAYGMADAMLRAREYEVRLIRRPAIQPRREVPAPETESPGVGDEYWLAAPTTIGDPRGHTWHGMDYERLWLAAGLVYLNREDRDARVAAMLALEGRE